MSPPLKNLVTCPFLPTGREGTGAPPPAILLIQIPGPHALSQTCLTPPFPSQADFAPRSATRESHPAVPSGPRPVDPPRPTPRRSSACTRHFSKDGQLPYRAPPHYRPDECRVRILAQLRTSSARGTSGRPGRSGGGLAHLSPKGDTPAREKETAGSWQAAAGGEQRRTAPNAEC